MSCRPGALLLASLAALLVSGGSLADPPPKQVAGPPPPPGAAPAPSGDAKDRSRRAMVLHDEAWALYEQGHYRAAIEKLGAALALDPQGKELVYNLALIHEKLADVEAAAGYYRRYLSMETDPKARDRIQAILRRLEGARSELAPARAASAPASAPAPPPAPTTVRPVRTSVIVTGTVAAGAFLLGSVFGLAAVARNPGSSAQTGGGVTIADLERDARAAHTAAMVADASFLIAALTGGVALALYFTTPPVRTAAPPPRVSLVAGAGRAALEVRFR